jgi:4-hydroxybenzoate polyprenyltransferase
MTREAPDKFTDVIASAAKQSSSLRSAKSPGSPRRCATRDDGLHQNLHGTDLIRLPERLTLYARLMRLDRPIGIYLLLWPALWALWFAARGVPDLRVLIVFVLGVVLMRSAGCAINDYADRDIDGHVARTRDRPLASGQLAPWEALAVFAVLSLMAFALTLLLNPLTSALSVAGALLAASYPYMKRFHPLPQVHLGATFGWAIPMAFAAQTGEFPPTLAWLLFVSTVAWTTAYDTIYAISDREDDRRLGVKSTALFFDSNDRLIIGMLQAFALLGLTFAGWLTSRGLPYALGLLCAATLAIYQQKLIAARDPGDCQRAFRNNNYCGMAVFIGLAADYALSA